MAEFIGINKVRWSSQPVYQPVSKILPKNNIKNEELLQHWMTTCICKSV